MKIGTVSEASGLGIHTIRYYEKQGLIKQPVKDESGHRNYDSRDLELLNWITCMKNSGMPLKRIKEYTHASYQGDMTITLFLLEQHLKSLFKQYSEIEHYIDVTKSKINSLKSLT